jgi:hypothetical protein
MSLPEVFEGSWISQEEDEGFADDDDVSSTGEDSSTDEDLSTDEDSSPDKGSSTEKGEAPTDEDEESEDDEYVVSTDEDSSTTDEDLTDEDARTGDDIVSTDEELELVSRNYFTVSRESRLQSIRMQFESSKRHQSSKKHKGAAVHREFIGYDLAELQTYANKGPKWLDGLSLRAILELCVRRYGKVFSSWGMFQTFSLSESYCSQGGFWSAEAGIRELIQNWYIRRLYDLLMTLGGMESYRNSRSPRRILSFGMKWIRRRRPRHILPSSVASVGRKSVWARSATRTA